MKETNREVFKTYNFVKFTPKSVNYDESENYWS